jgi:hypothetical protein
VATVINDITMEATDDIKDIELRVRVMGRLRLAAYDAARALQVAEDRRLRPKRAQDRAKHKAEMNEAIETLKRLQAGLDRLEAYRQNSKIEAESSSTNTSEIPDSAEAPATEHDRLLHSETGPP